MEKKIINKVSILVSVAVGVLIVFFVYWPFAKGFINERRTIGDAGMHLANIISFQRDHPFIVTAWKVEWGGYPVIEGYPWLQYYLIQPILSSFKTAGIAMDYYMAAFLLVYYVVAFLLISYVSGNVFLALLLSVVLIYGADSQMPFTVNAFMTFVGSQFFLPLVLLTTIIARARDNFKLFLLSVILLSVSFYSHGAMTGIIIVPVIIPFLLLDLKGKISRDSFLRTIKYFCVFAFISSVQIYQFISYNSQGYLRGVKPFPLSVIPARLINLFSWVNPVLIVFAILLIPLLIFAIKKSFSDVKPYLLSLLLLIFVFILMVFNITSMNLVLLAERVLWALSLILLLLFAKSVMVITGTNVKKMLIFTFLSLIGTAGYLYLTLVVKPPHIVPDTLKAMDPYNYFPSTEIPGGPSPEAKFPNKYDYLLSFPAPSWSKSFDNYRADGESWAVYSNWNIWSSNPRYKGRFPAAKGLPLDWSGLVTAAGYGNLGEAGTPDTSVWAQNQTLFFFDWYAIRHLETLEAEKWPDFLLKEPLITSMDQSLNVTYRTIDEKYIGPMYAPTNVPTMAVVSSQKQYDNFIRTLSFSDFDSKKLIPVYLGPSLSSLNKNNLKYFDSIFIYGYRESVLSQNVWSLLNDYVKNGGKLIIETGQKVSETASAKLPEVFPVNSTEMKVMQNPWSLKTETNDLTKNITTADFAPFKTKYQPYAVSETRPAGLKSWAKPVLTTTEGNVVMAYGNLGKGSVVWSGINLPFHAIDNRNTSETVIFANALNWFFPKTSDPITGFTVGHPKPEKITVASDSGKGFLIKENYAPGWVATLNGKMVKIYDAGLFEMYIPFDSSGGTQTLVLTYYGAPVYWLLFFISLTSLVCVFVYLIFNKNVLSLIHKLPKLPSRNDENEDY